MCLHYAKIGRHSKVAIIITDTVCLARHRHTVQCTQYLKETEFLRHATVLTGQRLGNVSVGREAGESAEGSN